MTITVYKKYEIDYSNNEILEFKKEYINNPDYCVDLSNKDEFIEVMRDYFYKDEEYEMVVDNKLYSDFCKKWNEM